MNELPCPGCGVPGSSMRGKAEVLCLTVWCRVTEYMPTLPDAEEIRDAVTKEARAELEATLASRVGQVLGISTDDILIKEPSDGRTTQ